MDEHHFNATTWGVLPVEAFSEVTDWPGGRMSRYDVPGVAILPDGRIVLFARTKPPVQIYSPSGDLLASWGSELFQVPHGVTAAPDGTLFITDTASHTVRQFTPDGRLLLTLGTGRPSDSGSDGTFRTVRRGAPPFNSPTNLAIAPSGDLYVTDGYGNARVHRFGADGHLIQSWGEPGDAPGCFRLPHGVAVAPDGRVIVADRENRRVQVFGPEGAFLAQWTELRRPTDIHLDDHGRAFVTELGTLGQEASRVTVFDLDGRVLGSWEGPLAAAHAIRGDASGALYVGEVTWTERSQVVPDGFKGVHKFVPSA